MKLPMYISVFMIVSSLLNFAQAEDHSHHAKMEKPAVEEVLPDESLYNLNSSLLDVNGKTVPLASLRGKPVVISMAYTACAYTCPLILSHMQQLEKALEAKGKVNVQFILVSFDPKRDTPQVLADYTKKKKLSKNWSLLTSKSDKEPREIASLLGIKYKEVEGGDYDHSFVIAVLDKDGVIRGKQVGASSDPKDLMRYLP